MREVRDLDLKRQIPYYKSAIEEVGNLFVKTMGKQRQVTRDLRGLFLNRMVQQVSSQLEKDPTMLPKVGKIINEILLPFARTGNRQKPFAPLFFKGGLEEVIYTEDPLSTFDRNKLYERPSMGKEREKTELDIVGEIFSRVGGSYEERLTSKLSEIEGETPIHLETWSNEVQTLHRALLEQGRPSPLIAAYEKLKETLISAYYMVRGCLERSKKEPTREQREGFERVRAYCSEVHSILSESGELLSIEPSTEKALKFDLEAGLSQLSKHQEYALTE